MSLHSGHERGFEALREAEPEAVEELPLGRVWADDASKAELTGRSAEGSTTSTVWMRASSSSTVRGLFPSWARSCHRSKVFQSACARKQTMM